MPACSSLAGAFTLAPADVFSPMRGSSSTGNMPADGSSVFGMDALVLLGVPTMVGNTASLFGANGGCDDLVYTA